MQKNQISNMLIMEKISFLEFLAAGAL